MEQHIAELSAIIDTIVEFADDCKRCGLDIGESNKAKIIKNFAKSAIVYDDFKNVFYSININTNYDIFLCDPTDIAVNLLWLPFSDAYCGIMSDDWLIPISVIVSIYNRYLMYKVICEFLLSLIIDADNSDIILPITISSLDSDSSIAICKGINDLYSLFSLLTNVYRTTMSTYVDTHKYYDITDYIELIKMFDGVPMSVMSIGLSCNQFSFSVTSPHDAMCIKVHPDDVSTIISISRQHIDCTLSTTDTINKILNDIADADYDDDADEYEDDI